MKRVVKAEEIGYHKTRDSSSAIDGHYADMSQVVTYVVSYGKEVNYCN